MSDLPVTKLPWHWILAQNKNSIWKKGTKGIEQEFDLITMDIKLDHQKEILSFSSSSNLHIPYHLRCCVRADLQFTTIYRIQKLVLLKISTKLDVTLEFFRLWITKKTFHYFDNWIDFSC
jgi:hypothetical protein